MCDNQIEQQVSIWWKIISKCNLSLPFDFIVYTSPLGIATVNGRTCNAHNHRTYQPKKKKNNDHKIWLACIMCECISSRLQSLMLCATFAFFAIWHPVQTHAQTHKRMQSSYSHALCFCERIRLFRMLYIYIYICNAWRTWIIRVLSSVASVHSVYDGIFIRSHSPIQEEKRLMGHTIDQPTDRPRTPQSLSPTQATGLQHTHSVLFSKFHEVFPFCRMDTKSSNNAVCISNAIRFILARRQFPHFLCGISLILFFEAEMFALFFVCVRCCCRGHSPTSGRCARMATYCYRTRYSSPSRHDSRKK